MASANGMTQRKRLDGYFHDNFEGEEHVNTECRNLDLGSANFRLGPSGGQEVCSHGFLRLAGKTLSGLIFAGLTHRLVRVIFVWLCCLLLSFGTSSLWAQMNLPQSAHVDLYFPQLQTVAPYPGSGKPSSRFPTPMRQAFHSHSIWSETTGIPFSWISAAA